MRDDDDVRHAVIMRHITVGEALSLESSTIDQPVKVQQLPVGIQSSHHCLGAGGIVQPVMRACVSM
jgi:hypothetical protein